MKKTYINLKIFIAVMNAGLIFLLFSIYFNKSDFFLMYDSKRFFVISIVIFSSTLLLFSTNIKQLLTSSLVMLPLKLKIVIPLMLLSMFIASVSGQNFIQSQSILIFNIGLMLTTCILYIGMSKHRGEVLSIFILFMFLLFLSVASAYWISIYHQIETSLHSILSFGNPRFLNQVQVWITLPVFYLAILSKFRNRNNYKLLIIVLSANMCSLIATEARGLAVALLGSIVLWAIMDKAWRVEILKTVVIVSILGYLIKLVLLSPLPVFLLYGELETIGIIREGTSGRISLWIDSLPLLTFFGTGGGSYVCAYEVANVVNTGHPHNSVIQIWTEWGVLSLLIYVSMILMLFLSTIKTKRRLMKMFGLSLISGLVYSLVSGVLTMPLSQLFFVISIALYWSSACKLNLSQLNKSVSLKNKTMSGLLCASIIIVMTNFILERIEVYQSGILISDQIKEGRHGAEFWLGHNCKI